MAQRETKAPARSKTPVLKQGNVSEAANRDKRERTYLAVPYDEREEAKKLGARFDRKAKSWFAPTAEIAKATMKWSVEGKAPAAEQKRDPEGEFSKWLRSKNVVLGGLAQMDGKWHRVKIDGDPDKSASYRGFLEGGVPNGMLHNFRGKQERWVFEDLNLSKDEIQRAIEAGKKASRNRDNERRLDQEKAAKTAYGIWANMTDWAKPSNCEYLKRKNVLGFGVKLDKDARMVIPLRDTDLKIHSLQFVGEGKHYLKHGRKEGLFHAIDPKRYLNDAEKPGQGDTLIFAEGYATGASVHKLTNKPVIVTFDADNLVKVATALRDKFPDVTMLFAADDDHHLTTREKPLPNKGMEKAIEAAQAVGGYVVRPPLNKADKAKGLKDWNDLTTARGEERAASQFITQVRLARKLGNAQELQIDTTKSKQQSFEQEMSL
ncbi:DNA primase TraC [Pseudovibrio sp. W64]|uniref:DUF5710 domain-containing protein n=1 Tax=unclassified Pseudovibrio TaxID=2627060 RepID=UPI0007AE4C3E|nr:MULTISPECIES: DUF5710 domain-containing protein [unclassified Pseudovibrio]KZK87638.1 DNA primase TraC [Pseudovibrio sp. W64]KZK98956.1 DNA primase TraC [Pseudovibrio sp. Ad5]